MIAEDPLTAVAIGTGKFIEFAHGRRKTTIKENRRKADSIKNMAAVKGYIEK